MTSQADEADDEDDLSLADMEVEVITKIIKDNLGKKYRDRDGTERTITPDDIAVLSRGRDRIPAIERHLNNEGIPAYGETDGGYYETVEIQVFLNLLQVISNRNQDVPLISAMSSVVFDFKPRELAQIRIEHRRGSFYEAVRSYETEGQSQDIREKITDMLRRGKTPEEIADFCAYPMDLINEIQKELQS